MEVLRSKVAERPERDATIEGIYGSKGFFFQQRRGHLDLRGISGIDLEKVVREVDVDTLQLYIENITFCNLREEDLRYLTDPQVIKMFKMSQLIIEYLLYSQDLFVANLGELSKKYVAKKKSLSKKRRELAELEEATKHLRNQVKAKKQNISTLEDLLRENSRRAAHEPKTQPVEQPRQVKPEKISFYVAGPDGLCIEFSERVETSIYNLRKSVSLAFVSKKDTESENYNKVVRLVHRGILLMDDKTIEYYGIKSGDTVVTVVEKGEAVTPAPAVQKPAPANDNHLTEMIEFLSKQQDAMRQFANDIKYGWESALQTIKSNRDGDHNLEDSEKRLLTKIDDKWNLFESGMKLQLEAKLNDYQALLLAQKNKEEHLPNIQVIRRRPHVGELEDDNDAPALNDITDKLNQFGSQLNRLEVKTTHTDESVEDLRGMLRNRPAAAPTPVIINTTTTVPTAAPPVLGTKPVAKVEITPPLSPKKAHEMKVVKNDGNAYNAHYNKWNHLSDNDTLKAASNVVEKDQAQVSLGSFEVPATVPVVEKKPEPVVVKTASKVKSPPPAAKPAEKKVAARKEPEKKPAVQMVDIVFPAVYHTDDMAVFHGEKLLMVQLPENLPAEDVVFILRKEIANKVQVPLTRVTLVLRGKSITLDVDADEEVLTVESVKSYAANGVLIFKVNKGKPLTNAQLDLLVPSWQRASREGSLPVTPTVSEGEKSGSSKRLKKRRDWNDEEDVPDNDPQMLSKNMYKVVRGSLDEALSGVSDREGLTDDELQKKMQSLKEFTESLPSNVADHMRNYKGKVTRSITTATIDSGSEDLLPQVTLLKQGSGGDVRESQTLVRSRLLSVSRSGHLTGSPVPTLAETGGVRRSIEEYNSEEDFVSKYAQLKDDSPAMASVTNSVDMRAQFRSATSGTGRAESKSLESPLRGLSSANSTTRSNNGKKDEAKLVNTTSTTDSLLYSPSQSISSNRPGNRYPTSNTGPLDEDSELDDDEDDDHEYTTVSRVQNRGKGGIGNKDNNQMRASGEFGEGARIDKTMLSSINTLNTIGENSDGEHYDVMDEVDSDVGDYNDLSRTVDSEGDMLVRNHAVRSSAVRRKADEYEKDAAASDSRGGSRGSVPRTPPHRDHNRDSPESKSRYDNRTFSNASKASNVSLFQNLQSGDMVDDFEDSVHSLALSNNDDD